jgi:hypothetical protein
LFVFAKQIIVVPWWLLQQFYNFFNARIFQEILFLKKTFLWNKIDNILEYIYNGISIIKCQSLQGTMVWIAFAPYRLPYLLFSEKHMMD